ncbi:MAG TPA: 2-phospho-L-lactate guanylyltransferase [Chromatiales bacterium]|nr:2-phospho-L-lactate guanylyltransferase [Chromatiales bacterium]
MSFVAVVPVKPFDAAKRRLQTALDTAECAGLAEAMLRDVLDALAGSRACTSICLLGGADARRLAQHGSLRWIDDAGHGGLNSALELAAAKLAAEQVDTLLVLPGDLPCISAADLDALDAVHRGGLTVCPARRDGGTNALMLSPPDAINFHFGPDSARRHLEAGIAAGLASRLHDAEAFGLDVDTADDLLWLCQHAGDTHTGRFLQSTGIADRLLRTAALATGRKP